ncbi:MAG: hypothetical protein WBM90_06630 [Acidimicrobiia bacterium]
MRHRSPERAITQLVARIAGRLCAASFIGRTLMLGMVALLTSGVAHAIAQPARHNSAAADSIVKALVAGDANPAQIPSEFVRDLGYTPTERSGTLLAPHGGCSTPGGIGPSEFGMACQTHDLGYDVLRYAEMEHGRLSAKARLELDWMLYVDLLHTCEDPLCSATATAYYGAVSANSIRQGFKAPHAEPATPWVALAVAVVGLSAVGGLPVMKTIVETIDSGSGVRRGFKMRRRLEALGSRRRRLIPGGSWIRQTSAYSEGRGA